MHGFDCGCVRCKKILEGLDVDKLKNETSLFNPILNFVNYQFNSLNDKILFPKSRG